jgi:hypothetical protein
MSRHGRLLVVKCFVGFIYMFGLVLWRYLIFSVKLRHLGCCHLDPSSHLFVRTDTKIEHWNYSFARFGLEIGIVKELFSKHG